jgi:hypothetical protein
MIKGHVETTVRTGHDARVHESARYVHVLPKLPTDLQPIPPVLVAGGVDGSGHYFTSSEVYQPYSFDPGAGPTSPPPLYLQLNEHRC